MSTVHVAWAMEQTTGSASRKAVLVNLAEFANGVTGKCCPCIATIARRTELSEATVKRCLNDLEETGFVSRTRDRRPDGTLGVYRYRLPLVTVAVEPQLTVLPDPGVTMRSQEPGTSLEPRTPPVVPPAIVEPQSWAPSSVGGKQVATSDALQAVAVLQEWNLQAKQGFTSKEWVGKIIMRQREHPELTADDHAAIIAANLANPWWKNTPSPSVIYGNSQVFEQAMETAQAAARGEPGGKKEPLRYGRGLTTRQILDMTQGGTDDDG